jgi:hypothetical protein
MWIVIKVARAGRLIWEKRFETLEEVSKHLKCSDEIVKQIMRGERFPKGKTCVFNKFVIREEVESDKPKHPFGVISFD